MFRHVTTCTGRWLVSLTCAIGAASVTPVLAQHPQAILDQAEGDFGAGRLHQAVAGFDRLAALDPESAPWLWQRGIALYYLGDFAGCSDQFAAYQRVNPGDLESAVWHVACVARRESLDVARARMFPPGRDGRVMRAEVYQMFAGRLPSSVVVERAGFVADVAVFYAHFYAGLLAEVSGDSESAVAHLRQAASDRFADVGGFMNIVAHVHLARLSSDASPGVVTPVAGAELERTQ